ncbi:ImmA/IrrE family metallo-endopeptidase [Clostridium sp.]|uniref:ImmA/IrrE family metallo-endopeptidase n=1 Tax=Clostridium sp. TaxID=1506 RepID=UPI003216A97B
MSTYEEVLINFENKGVEVIELDLGTNKECGKCIGNMIFINKNLNTKQKYCVLIEELGHYYTSTGDITNQNKTTNRKQELIARRWGYKYIIGIVDLINAHRHGCMYRYEIAEYLGITESFLEETIDYYNCKYENGCEIDNYWINFNSGLHIFEKF